MTPGVAAVGPRGSLGAEPPLPAMPSELVPALPKPATLTAEEPAALVLAPPAGPTAVEPAAAASAAGAVPSVQRTVLSAISKREHHAGAERNSQSFDTAQP